MGRMLRPKRQILPDSAMVEKEVAHRVSGRQPYFLERPGKQQDPAGALAKGSLVMLISKGPGELCLARDSKGRLIYTAFAGLKPVD